MYRTRIQTLMLVAVVAWVAIARGVDTPFQATLGKLLDYSYIPEDNFSEHHSLWQQLLAQGTKRQIRDALRQVLLDANRENQWLNALRLASDAEMDSDFLLYWARHAIKHGGLLEHKKAELFSAAKGLIKRFGGWEDVALLQQVASNLPGEFAFEKKHLLIMANEELPFWIRQREQAMKESGNTRMGPEPDEPGNPFEALETKAASSVASSLSVASSPHLGPAWSPLAWVAVGFAAACGCLVYMRSQRKV